MSLIPFILDLADELHEFNRCLAAGGMDVDDFGFGIYPHELQQQHHLLQSQSPQQTRRPRAVSQLYWLPTISKGRHHPYYRNKTCCNKSAPSHLLTDSEKESSTPNVATAASGGVAGSGEKEGSSPSAAGKSAYSVVNKNGFQVSMNVKQFAPNELTVKTIDNCIVVEGQHEDKEDGHGVISRHFIRKYMLPKGYDPNEVLSTLSSDGILTVKAPPPTTKTDEPMERIVDIQQTGPAHLSVKDSNKEQQKTTATATAAATVTATATPAAKATAAAVTPAVTAANATAAPQQQQQQQLQPQPQPQPQKELQKPSQSQPQSQSQSQQPPELQKSHERNGNANPNEISTEQETEPAEPTSSSALNASASTSISFNSNTNSNTNSISISNSTEQPGAKLLASKAATPTIAVDAIVAAATTAANDEDNEDANMDVNVHVGISSNTDTGAGSNSHDAGTNVGITSCNSNNNTNTNTNDNGIAEMPTAAVVVPIVAMPADVTVVGIETIPVTVIDGAVAVAEDDVEAMEGVVVGVGVSGDEDGKTAAVETLMVAAQPPTAADLVAAADAAILLAKTQCENGNGQKAVVTEEITN